MKKRWLFVLIAVVILLAIPAGSLAAGGTRGEVLLEGEESPEVTPTPTRVLANSVTLKNLPENINLGKTGMATADVVPSEANASGLADFTWSSSNTSVLIIEEHANDCYADYKAVGTGTATVTVKVDGLSASATVTVTQAHVESLSLVNLPAKVNLGVTGMAWADFEPYEADYNGLADFTWSSSNTSVITVREYTRDIDDDFIDYEAVGTGTATITVKVDGLSASATVTVTQAHVESLSLENLPAKVNLGVTYMAWADVEPYEANYNGIADFTWSSSNTSVLTIEEHANDCYADYKAVGPGTATVTVKVDGLSASAAVTVTRAHVESLSLAYFPTNFYVSQEGWVYVNFEPYEANTNGLADFTWSSSNTSVLTVAEWASDDSCVYYKAIGPGTATVTVKADGISASVIVTVSGTPTPTFVPTPTVTATSSATPRPPSSAVAAVVPTPDPTRGTEGEGYSGPMPTRMPIELEASDWEAAQQAIAGMEPGSLGSIQLPDDTLVPASLLETLRQTQCALEIDMGGYLCVIDGAYLAEIPDGLAAIDIGMTMEKDAAVSAACGGSAYELRFSYHGELPGTFTFRVPAEGSSPGDTIYLYYLNEDTGVFEGVHTAIVDDEGYVSLNITHCSSYFITDIMIEGAVNNFALPAQPTAEPEAQHSSGFAAFVENNAIAFWICVYVLGCGVIITLFVVIFRRRNKRKEEPVQHTYVK